MNKKILRRFLPYIFKYKLLLVISLVTLIFATLSSTIIPYLLKQAIDKYITVKNFQGLIKISFIFLGACGIFFVSKLGQIYFTNLTGQKIMRDLSWL